MKQNNKKKTSLSSAGKGNADCIVNLLVGDIEDVASELKKGKIPQTLANDEIENIVKLISTHDRVETIENNLFDLYKNKKNACPTSILEICERYKAYLNVKKEDVSKPDNYAITSIEYITALQSETTAKLNRSEKSVNKLIEETHAVKESFEEKIFKTKDSIILLTVTVLGIFSSLTFSLSGSLSILNNVFSENYSFAESLFRYSLIGIFVANLVFLLIYTIAKLNNKSIAMHCSVCPTTSYICMNCDVRKNCTDTKFEFKKECHGCEHKNTSCQECNKKNKSILCKLTNKFSYIFTINVICFVMLVFSLVLGVTGWDNYIFRDDVVVTESFQNNKLDVAVDFDYHSDGIYNTEDVAYSDKDNKIYQDRPITNSPVETEASFSITE